MNSLYFNSLVFPVTDSFIFPVKYSICKQYKNHCTIFPPNHIDIFKSFYHIIISPYHYFFIRHLCPKQFIWYWNISPFGKQYKNYCTISPPNHIYLFKLSYHITISQYHDFSIFPFHRGTKNINQYIIIQR